MMCVAMICLTAYFIVDDFCSLEKYRIDKMYTSDDAESCEYEEL